LTATKKPRKHHHLSRESIARAALELIDSEGIDAFSLRRLAQSLKVSAMSLYTYATDKDGIIRDVVALLLSEVVVVEDPAVRWEEAVLAGGKSLRAMALRHPRAWPLVALAPYDTWPMTAYGRRVDEALMRQGLPRELLPLLGSVIDAYATGFLLLETKALATPVASTASPFDGELQPPAPLYAMAHPEEAFDEGGRTIIAGLKARFGLASGAPAREGDC